MYAFVEVHCERARVFNWRLADCERAASVEHSTISAVVGDDMLT